MIVQCPNCKYEGAPSRNWMAFKVMFLGLALWLTYYLPLIGIFTIPLTLLWLFLHKSYSCPKCRFRNPIPKTA